MLVLGVIHRFKLACFTVGASFRPRETSTSTTSSPSSFEIGESAKVERCFSSHDVETFAKLTGDHNPIHSDSSAAVKSHFKRPVVHGALINGVISSVIGTILPGTGSILVEQDLHFPNPLYHDEPFVTEVTIADRKRNLYLCRYQCVTADGKIVTEGMAKILFRRP